MGFEINIYQIKSLYVVCVVSPQVVRVLVSLSVLCCAAVQGWMERGGGGRQEQSIPREQETQTVLDCHEEEEDG